MSLTKAAGKGFFWVAIERFGQQFLSGITFIVLARLLTPADFGLIGMLLIFLAVSESIVESGMGQALIREKKISSQDRATVFWLNLGMSLLFYAILYFAAPWIAGFYKQAELTDLIRFMGLGIIFNAMAIIQRSELTQQLQFKKQAYAQVPALFISGATAIVLAFMGLGVWALAVQFILTSFLSSSILWILSPVKILFTWNKESFLRLFSFGYKLLLSGFLDTTYQHIYKLIIGKVFLTATLGFYTQAQKLQQLASQTLSGVIQKVTYPLLSKAGDDPDRLKRGYRQVIQSSSFIIFPPMLLLLVFAEPIMYYVLGPQWLPAAPFLQLLCLSGMLYHLHSINLNVLKVLGRSDLFLKLEIIKKINITIAIVIGLQYGIYGLLIGRVISSYIALIINTYYTAKFLDYSLLEQVEDVLKVFVLSIPMILISILLSYLLPVGSLAVLISYGILAGVLYLLTNLLYRTKVTELAFNFLEPYLPVRIKKLLHI